MKNVAIRFHVTPKQIARMASNQILVESGGVGWGVDQIVAATVAAAMEPTAWWSTGPRDRVTF